jgi:hypothetical protein
VENKKYITGWYQAVGCNECLKIFEQPEFICPSCGDSKRIYADGLLIGWARITVRQFTLSKWFKPNTWFKAYYEIKPRNYED